MKKTIVPIMIFFLMGLLSSISQASPLLPSPYFQLASNNQGLDSAVQTIKQKTGGRIHSAKTENKKGQRTYKIKVLLPSGKVQTFKISAQ